MKKIIVGLIFIMTICAAGNVYSATLGRRYIGGSFGYVKFGDDWTDDIFGSMNIFQAGLNTPINRNTDFTVGFGRSHAESYRVYFPDYRSYGKLEATSLAFSGGINYQFLPDEQVNPYLSVGFSGVKSELKLKIEGYASETIDDNDIGFNFGFGVEFLLGDAYTEPEMSIKAALGYNTIWEGDLNLGVSFNAWVNPKVLLSVGFNYLFDEGDRVIHGGVGIGF